MNSSRFKPELYRVLIHPAMSVSVSASGILAAIWLVAVNFGVASPGLGIIAAVIVATLLEAAVGNILYRQRAGIGNRVRELVIYLIVVYAVFSLPRGGPLGQRFLPGFEQVLPVLAAAAAWLVAFVFHNRLRGREALLRAFAGKHGSELRHAVLDRQHDMAQTVGQLRNARRLIGGLFAVLCFLAVFGSIDPLGLSVLRAGSGAFVVLVVYGISAVAVVGNLNTFIDEYAANGEGIAVPLRFQRRRAVLAATVIAIVLFVAFALARNRSVLPLEAIVDFFRWLGSLFESEPNEGYEPPSFESPGQQQQLPPELLELLEDTEEHEPPLWLRVLAELLRRLALSALVVGAALLIFGPLFSKTFRAALRDLKPGAFLKGLWSDLRRRLRILGRFLRHGFRRRRQGDTDEEAEERTEDERWRERRWKPGLRKRRQMDRVVQVFLEVARWGERHGVSYHRTEGPHEYLARIATIRPERYPDARVVAETFCEAKFSRHLVPKERMREYVRSARRIARSE
jgi:predicted secreted protein